MLNVVQPQPHFVVAVVGTGVVGLAALMSLKTLQNPPEVIIAIDRVSKRLELAKSYGATHTIDSRDFPDLRKALTDITKGSGIDGSIDTTGRPEIINSLLSSIANKGKVVTVGVGDVRDPLWHAGVRMAYR
jgi:aryl-alcohol dehydrogenase